MPEQMRIQCRSTTRRVGVATVLAGVAALLGLGFVCVFVVVRAASFHHVDSLLGTWVFGVKMNWVLELPGPILVALVARRRRRTALPG